MKIRTFIVGCVLALALFLFAQRRSDSVQTSGFSHVLDLTHAINSRVPTYELSEQSAYQAKTVATIEKDHYFARNISLPEHFGTHIDAPAHFAPGMWTVDQIPPERLIAPLVVMDVSASVKGNSDYQILRRRHREMGAGPRPDSTGRSCNDAHRVGFAMGIHQRLPQRGRQGYYALPRIFAGCREIPG